MIRRTLSFSCVAFVALFIALIYESQGQNDVVDVKLITIKDVCFPLNKDILSESCIVKLDSIIGSIDTVKLRSIDLLLVEQRDHTYESQDISLRRGQVILDRFLNAGFSDDLFSIRVRRYQDLDHYEQEISRRYSPVIVLMMNYRMY